MTGEQAVNQNVSFYPTDLAILEAVQKRNGQTLSGAVRFILREWARTSGLQETIHTAALPQQVSKPRNVKPESIPGVKRGVKAA
jgi:hypothetical protein